MNPDLLEWLASHEWHSMFTISGAAVFGNRWRAAYFPTDPTSRYHDERMAKAVAEVSSDLTPAELWQLCRLAFPTVFRCP